MPSSLRAASACASATREASSTSSCAACPCSTGPSPRSTRPRRPLIRPETVEAVIARVRDDASLAGAICAHPSADTLKVVEGGIVRSTPDRSCYWAVQTPQVFRLATVLEAHLAAGREGFVGTDDASLVERADGRVAVVESPSDNMKVTVPEDRLPVEAILASRIASGEAPAAAREGARSC